MCLSIYPSILPALLASRHPVFFDLYNYSIRSSNCSVIFLWWFRNMVFKDCLYFQINKFMEKRAWPVLFLFLTTILQKSTCNFWLTQWTSASPGLPNGLLLTRPPTSSASFLPGKSWLPALELLCYCCNSPSSGGKSHLLLTHPFPECLFCSFLSSSPHSLNIQ